MSDTVIEGKVRGVAPTYYSFLMGAITQIRERWAEGDLVKALQIACELVIFLPKAQKGKLKPKRKEIMDKLKTTAGLTGSDFLSKQMARNDAAMRIASECLEDFVDEIMLELDAKGYLEITRPPIQVGTE